MSKKLGKWILCYSNSPVQTCVVCICLCAVGVWVVCFCFGCICRTAHVSVGRCLWAGGLRCNWLGPVYGFSEPSSTTYVSLGTQLPGIA